MARRRCVGCGCFLRTGNTDTLCAACQVRDRDRSWTLRACDMRGHTPSRLESGRCLVVSCKWCGYAFKIGREKG